MYHSLFAFWEGSSGKVFLRCSSIYIFKRLDHIELGYRSHHRYNNDKRLLQMMSIEAKSRKER